MNRYFIKTHYECVMDYLKIVDPDIFTPEMFETGNDPIYDDFRTVVYRSLPLDYDPKQLNNFLNIYFHLYQMKQQGEKIYYITPELSVKLAQTNLNSDTYFLKSPFREIFVQIDPGLFFIKDIDNQKVPIHGFYIYLRDIGSTKHIRIIACSLLKPTPKIPFNDTVFYFHLELHTGKLQDQIKKFIEKELTKYQQELTKYQQELTKYQQELTKYQQELIQFDTVKNIDYLEDFTLFIFNTLLYITSKNPDLAIFKPPDFSKKLNGIKSKGKRKKTEKRLNKTNTYNIIIVGSNQKDSRKDIENIKNSGGIGAWKLQYKIKVSAHWRMQWYGSIKNNTRHCEHLWIDSYEKGPEFAETLNSKYIVK